MPFIPSNSIRCQPIDPYISKSTILNTTKILPSHVFCQLLVTAASIIYQTQSSLLTYLNLRTNPDVILVAPAAVALSTRTFGTRKSFLTINNGQLSALCCERNIIR